MNLYMAFDWQAGRTWQVFVGYAFALGVACGSVAGVCHLGALILVPGPEARGQALIALLFLGLALVLAALLVRRADRARNGAVAAAIKRWCQPDTAIIDRAESVCLYALWIFLMGFAQWASYGGLLELFGSQEMYSILFLFIILLAGQLGGLFIVSVMDRWVPRRPEGRA